ncbi:MAG: hypothetical protein BroJett021_21220 [Chloroflexota bacterium]|nr:hypothetical protein [Caldilinea sp.]GIK73134.1 MAG: hypothetical protein BroJett021_21220 [Chloroflexota bacterium]
MFDYNFLMMSRHEYEERIRKAEQEILAQQSRPQQPTAWDRLLFAIGQRLERFGAYLKAQHQPERRYQPAPMHQSYRGRAS